MKNKEDQIKLVCPNTEQENSNLKSKLESYILKTDRRHARRR